MINQLTIPNINNYLESMSFSDILYIGKINNSFYFSGKDGSTRKEIEFDPTNENTIIVSVKEGYYWHILDVLKE